MKFTAINSENIAFKLTAGISRRFSDAHEGCTRENPTGFQFNLGSVGIVTLQQLLEYKHVIRRHDLSSLI